MKNFTFKKRPLGKFDIWHITDIKCHGKEVGYIAEHEDGWHVRLQCTKSPKDLEREPNCPWKWRSAKEIFPTEERAKEELKARITELLPSLYIEED
jgi:hypothetical protein